MTVVQARGGREAAELFAREVAGPTAAPSLRDACRPHRRRAPLSLERHALSKLTQLGDQNADDHGELVQADEGATDVGQGGLAEVYLVSGKRAAYSRRGGHVWETSRTRVQLQAPARACSSGPWRQADC